ncbi:aminotransferase class I and II [Candidatus Moduliflexus flocculans]|uniref:Aminotransferase class I and II n=1 Tax=Candidatus Moduliflexus flocculans TaxID=1499966 RepID=A0A081BNQ4_9BACT|nr:aminotransferase class I and II [Candidatus Moduliflexus flocculans]
MKIEPFRLERYFAKYEFTAPYLLCCSDCESFTVGELLQFERDAQEALSSLWLGYTESQGHPELRAQIAALYQQISPDEILVHAGAEEAIFNVMQVVLSPGDHVVVHSPYYQSLGEVARSLGAVVLEWNSDPQRGWELAIASLKEILTEKTKMVVINVPHNPTGFLPSVEFLRELSKLSEEKGFLVFSDEVYRGLEYDPALRLPAFADINERGISLGVMSKTYGLAGLRIGWIATRNAEVRRALAAFKDYTTICNSAPSEFLATLALRHREYIVARNLGIIKQNLELLRPFFEKHADKFRWDEPKAGPIAFPRYLGGSAERFCHDLVQGAGVLLLPGAVYGEGLPHFRIGFGRKNMPYALERLETFLN